MSRSCPWELGSHSRPRSCESSCDPAVALELFSWDQRNNLTTRFTHHTPSTRGPSSTPAPYHTCGCSRSSLTLPSACDRSLLARAFSPRQPFSSDSEASQAGTDEKVLFVLEIALGEGSFSLETCRSIRQTRCRCCLRGGETVCSPELPVGEIALPLVDERGE